MTFALTEAILCLATLAQRFQLRLQDNYVVNPVCRLTLRPEGGLPMTIHARQTLPARPATEAPRACPFVHG